MILEEGDVVDTEVRPHGVGVLQAIFCDLLGVR